DGFGPGANGPLLVALDLAESPAPPAAAERIGATLGQAEGVAAVIPPQINEAGDAAVVTVVPEAGPQDEATEDLVHELRDDVLPAAAAGTGAEASVGGMTASFIDESEYTGGRLPLFIGGVVTLSF